MLDCYILKLLFNTLSNEKYHGSLSTPKTYDAYGLIVLTHYQLIVKEVNSINHRPKFTIYNPRTRCVHYQYLFSSDRPNLKNPIHEKFHGTGGRSFKMGTHCMDKDSSFSVGFYHTSVAKAISFRQLSFIFLVLSFSLLSK